jgi:hypothetical protein
VTREITAGLVARYKKRLMAHPPEETVGRVMEYAFHTDPTLLVMVDALKVLFPPSARAFCRQAHIVRRALRRQMVADEVWRMAANQSMEGYVPVLSEQALELVFSELSPAQKGEPPWLERALEQGGPFHELVSMVAGVDHCRFMALLEGKSRIASPAGVLAPLVAYDIHRLAATGKWLWDMESRWSAPHHNTRAKKKRGMPGKAS